MGSITDVFVVGYRGLTVVFILGLTVEFVWLRLTVILVLLGLTVVFV